MRSIKYPVRLDDENILSRDGLTIIEIDSLGYMDDEEIEVFGAILVEFINSRNGADK